MKPFGTTFIPNLSLITAEADLAGAEIELVGLDRREFRLRDALAPLRTQGNGGYTFILIDCPPSLGLLTLNGLVAADAVLVPLQCEFYALEGISGLVRTIEMVKRGLNPTLRLQGIVLTMFDRRNNLSDLVAADARGFFGETVYETVIPRNIRISEAPSHGKPVLLYDFRSPGAQAYVRLAGEVLRRERACSHARNAGMTTRKDATPRRLGRGLAALLGDTAVQPPPQGVGVRQVPLDLLEPNPFQPRTTIDAAALAELTQSIRSHGILQPLLVRPHPADRGALPDRRGRAPLACRRRRRSAPGSRARARHAR